ncbi:MAG: hypothetical protein ACPLUL_10760 [Thermanaerothrix sp.]|uniref:hypothetical protein n=1 Tax=Thermanaerothrix sp. TaxID=2972675 RepID=UPI003C7E63D0
MGDFTAALETCHQGLQEAARWDNAALAARLWLCRAQVCLKLGLIQTAWEALEQARTQVAALNKRNPVLSEVYVTQGDLWLALGDYAAALADFRAGLEVAQELHSSTEALYRLGWALVLSGQSQGGLNFLRRAIELTRTAEVTHVALAAEMALAEAHYTLGNLEEAQRIAHQAADEAAQRKMGYLLLRYPTLPIANRREICCSAMRACSSNRLRRTNPCYLKPWGWDWHCKPLRRVRSKTLSSSASQRSATNCFTTWPPIICVSVSNSASSSG